MVIDYAHNEAGMIGLTELCDGLRRAGREIWLGICAAGDRTEQILHDFGYRAARGADHVVVDRFLVNEDDGGLGLGLCHPGVVPKGKAGIIRRLDV